MADHAHKGHTVVRVYTENNTSASKRRVRPKFRDMLADAVKGEFDLILADHLDRLTRSIRDLLPLLDLATEHGVGTTTVSGELDLTTDMGRMLAGILGHGLQRCPGRARVPRRSERMGRHAAEVQGVIAQQHRPQRFTRAMARQVRQRGLTVARRAGYFATQS